MGWYPEKGSEDGSWVSFGDQSKETKKSKPIPGDWFQTAPPSKKEDKPKKSKKEKK